MKTNPFKISLLALVMAFSFSCTIDDSSSTTSTDTTIEITNTWVKLTAIASSGAPKQNYIIMMFDQPVSATGALPPVKKQILTDANGLAYFDLNTLVTTTTPTTYYFEAFVEDGEDFIWKSVTHPSFSIKKGDMTTSSIIVN